MKIFIKESDDPEDIMQNKLKSLKAKMAYEAQKVYDQWDQDDEGHDEHYGYGGICDDIADKMCEVIYNNTEYSCNTRFCEYDHHTSIYVTDEKNKITFNVDIQPYNYEEGAGYTWKKIKGVKFTEDMIDIRQSDYESFEDGEYYFF
jgi:hypothetical protein